LQIINGYWQRLPRYSPYNKAW